MSIPQDYTIPATFGPGMWTTIHLLAFNATSKNDQLQFIKTMKIIINNIPCHTCRGHAIEYINTHKMEDYLKDEYGMFLYTWKFHNAVNKRLGKDIMSYDMAFHRFNQLKTNEEAIVNVVKKSKKKSKSVCSKECSDADQPKVIEKDKKTKKHYVYETDKYYKK